MKKQIFFLILLFLLFCIFSLSDINNFCRIYPTLGADNESLLLWKYTAGMGVQPYKDIFYPYGLLTYYRDQNFFLTFFYFLLAPVLFVSIFLGLKRIFQDKLFLSLTTIIFLIFISTITGFETFTRYGPLAAAAIIFSYIFYENIRVSKKTLLVSGALIGLLFAFMNDFGFYTPVLFIGLVFVDKLIKSRFRLSRSIAKQFLGDITVFLFGYLVGLLPFLVYLLLANSFSGFLLYLQNLRDIAQFAKTPFFHSIGSIDNIFTIGILISTIFFLSFTLFFNKKISFNTYVQIGLTIVLLLLEQKSIIRSIDTQISFIALLLFFCLFYEIYQIMRTHKIRKSIIVIYFINISITIIFLIGLHPVNSQIQTFSRPNDILSAVTTFKNKSCIDQNINYLTSNNNQLLQVKDRVTRIEGFNGKIFTFPGEPIFYILFNQIPPYYPTIYEATPPYAQRQLINYIEDQHINFIIYNEKIKSIHDEVPDTVRGRLLYQYIMTHFSLYEKVDNYQIYKRNSVQ